MLVIAIRLKTEITEYFDIKTGLWIALDGDWIGATELDITIRKFSTRSTRLVRFHAWRVAWKLRQRPTMPYERKPFDVFKQSTTWKNAPNHLSVFCGHRKRHDHGSKSSKWSNNGSIRHNQLWGSDCEKRSSDCDHSLSPSCQKRYSEQTMRVVSEKQN